MMKLRQWRQYCMIHVIQAALRSTSWKKSLPGASATCGARHVAARDLGKVGNFTDMMREKLKSFHTPFTLVPKTIRRAVLMLIPAESSRCHVFFQSGCFSPQTECKDTKLILPKLILQLTRCQNWLKQSHRNIQVRPRNLNLQSCSLDRKRPSCISQRLVSARRRLLNVERFTCETRGALKQAKVLTRYNWHMLA